MGFDARAAKLLPPGQHITIDEQPGLRLVATKTRRAWIYRYKSPVDGRMRQFKLGDWPALSYHAAVTRWEELRAQRDAGGDPAQEKRAKASPRPVRAGDQLTVRDVCNLYLAGHVKNRTLKGYKEVARTFDTGLGAIEFMPAVEVTRKVAFAHIKERDATPVQASYLRRELGAAWDYCLDSGDLPEETPNWWRQVLRGKLRSKGHKKLGEHKGTAKRALTPEEAGRLIRWLPNFSNNVRDFLVLYLWAGVRGAEIEKIRGDEVAEEADGYWWTIPKAKTKNVNRQDATDHRVPLEGRALEVVKRRRELYGSGLLFPSNSKQGYFRQKSVSEAVYTAMPFSRIRIGENRPRLTVTDWAPHDLRRTARTYLSALGCPRDVAEVIIGHMLDGEEGTYNKYSFDKERRIWLRRLSEYLEGLAAA